LLPLLSSVQTLCPSLLWSAAFGLLVFRELVHQV
jgi:hypothetical protein